MKQIYLLILFATLTAASCGSGQVDQTEPDRSKLNIVLTDSLELDDDDGELRLPESIRNLSALLISESKKCEKAFILDPTLIRVDLDKELQLKTTIVRGGAKDVSNPIVIGKLINKNFDELNVPEAFSLASISPHKAFAQVNSWLLTKAPNDSLMVLSTDGSLTKYSVNNKLVPVFSNIEAIRKHVLTILCQNDKARFAVLYNPPQKPISSPPPPPPPPGNEGGNGHRGGKKHSPRAQIVIATPLNGICDPVTHNLYERVVDGNGRAQRGEKVLVVNCKECGY